MPLIEAVENTAMHPDSVDRNEVDGVGSALAGALQVWCVERDLRRLRRALLALLSALEET